MIAQCSSGNCNNCDSCRPDLVEQGYANEHQKIHALNTDIQTQTKDIHQKIGAIRTVLQFFKTA